MALGQDFLNRFLQQEQRFLSRNQRIYENRRLAWLDESNYDPPAGRVKVVSNLPMVAIRMATALLSRQRPFIHRILRDDTPDEAILAAEIEHFCYATMRSADQWAYDIGWMPFQHALSSMSLVDGWIAFESLLEPKGNFKVQTRALDPTWVFPVW